jgi:hypothetical protein
VKFLAENGRPRFGMLSALASANAVGEVRTMRTPENRYQSIFSFRGARFGWRSASVTAALLLVFAGAASAELPNSSTINKLALSAYCSQAKTESKSLNEGIVSYKQVAGSASHRALTEHPDVYRDSYAWKAKIVALLDQYGDEPTSELCDGKPSGSSD